MKKQIAAGLLALSMLLTGTGGITVPKNALVAEAAGRNVKIDEDDKTVAAVSGKKAKLSIAKGRKITSSNPKVASVNRK